VRCAEPTELGGPGRWRRRVRGARWSTFETSFDADEGGCDRNAHGYDSVTLQAAGGSTHEDERELRTSVKRMSVTGQIGGVAVVRKD